MGARSFKDYRVHSAAEKPQTISLIGMPGAGKSTVGVLLAKLAGLAFNETALEILKRLAGDPAQG